MNSYDTPLVLSRVVWCKETAPGDHFATKNIF